MSANRAIVGALALWATLCVVLLACATHGPARDTHALIGVQLHAAVAGTLNLPPAPAPEMPVSDPAAADTSVDTESPSPLPAARLRRTAWVARVPLWSADALRWQRLEPSLRLNPGHAPPYA
ncbi:MAG: hypothetical protein ACREPC_11680 [Stenotrophomonas sp.]|uniref:hypothetical protein n=1 Tax=Stenotrophomonas sp. TaxID=69392 RepID=UPI003D6D7E30